MGSRPPVLALDVGGTSVKGAIVAPSGELAGPLRRTPIDSTAGAEALLAALAGAVRELAPDAAPQLAGVAIAFPGPCDYARGVPGRHDDGKFAALAGVDLRAELRGRLGPPTSRSASATTPRRRSWPRRATAPAGRSARAGDHVGAGLGACLVAGGAIVAADAGFVPAGCTGGRSGPRPPTTRSRTAGCERASTAPTRPPRATSGHGAPSPASAPTWGPSSRRGPRACAPTP